MTDSTQTGSAARFAPEQRLMIETSRQVSVARFSPDGKLLIGAGYDGALHCWTISSDQPVELEPLKGHNGWVTCIAFAAASGDRPAMMLSTDSWGRLAARSIAELDAGCRWEHSEAHDGWIRDLAVSSDGATAITAGRDRCLRVWSVADGKLLKTLPEQPVELHCVAIHPSGREFVSSDLTATLKHWSVETGELIREQKFETMHLYERIQDVTGVRVLRFSPDGTRLLIGGSRPARTAQMQGIPVITELSWDSFEPARSWDLGDENNGYVFDFVQHESGTLLVVTSGTPGNGQFLLLDPDDKSPYFTYTKMSNCHSIALHPDRAEVLVSATNRNSQGNGAVRDKDGNYLGNSSPLHLFDLKPEA